MKHNDSVRLVVRTKKEDSAFLYHVLEAHEGLAAYSTVNYQVGDHHRDVELLVPQALLKDVKELLFDMKEIVEILEE